MCGPARPGRRFPICEYSRHLAGRGVSEPREPGGFDVTPPIRQSGPSHLIHLGSP
ncbi:hypothetical protein B0T16DRAFT_182385 [Cercophora newfieldiana]|uniref:Uncharacterized protein n=1 Tax=Cercophora newfieldiana TaxID=92897 RepID=A0AA40CM43_9PEZI|nr:hypothetical protein B0T16DRAFT_182385 [Cercophora newfieldiana]